MHNFCAPCQGAQFLGVRADFIIDGKGGAANAKIIVSSGNGLSPHCLRMPLPPMAKAVNQGIPRYCPLVRTALRGLTHSSSMLDLLIVRIDLASGHKLEVLADCGPVLGKLLYCLVMEHSIIPAQQYIWWTPEP